MVTVALDFKIVFKHGSIVGRITGKLDSIFIAVKFKKIHLVQLPCGIQSMGFQGRLVQLFHLRVEAIIFKNTAGAVGQIFHIKMDKLGPQSHHLVNSLNKVIGHFVAEPQSFAHVLVQRDGALTAPAAFIFL